MYNKLRIVFDPEKDKQNQIKHQGVSLIEAVDFDWGEAVYIKDERRDYGEHRVIAFGILNNRLFVVVFVDRKNERRVISLRKANFREVKRYAQT